MDAAPARLHHLGDVGRGQGCPFCRIPTPARRRGAGRRARRGGVRGAQPAPVQPRPPHGGALPARRGAGGPGRRRGRGADDGHPHRAAGAAGGRPRRTPSTWASTWARWRAARSPTTCTSTSCPRWGGDANFIAVDRPDQGHPAAAVGDPRPAGRARGPRPRAEEAAASGPRGRDHGSGAERGASGHPALVWRARTGPPPEQERCSTSSAAHVSRVTDPVGRWLVARGVSPDAVTVAGTVGTAAAAVVVHPRRPAVPRRPAGHGLRAVRHDRRRDGPRPRATAPRSGPCSTRSATGSPTARCSPRSPGGAWRAGRRRSGVAALVCLVAGQVISYVKARAEGAGLTADGGLVERPERLIAVAGRHRLRGPGHPVRAGHGAVAARGRVGVDGRAAHRRRAPLGPRGGRAGAATSTGPGPDGSADRMPRAWRAAALRARGFAALRGAAGCRPAPVDRGARPPRSPISPRRHRRRVRRRAGASSAACPSRWPAAASGSARTSRSGATAPGCGGCGRTCAGSSPTPRPDELDALVRAGMRSYARYWCEAFRLPAHGPRGRARPDGPARDRDGAAVRGARAGSRRRRGAAAQRQLGPRRAVVRGDPAPARPPRPVHHGGRAAAPRVAVPPVRRLPGGSRVRGAGGGRRAGRLPDAGCSGCATAGWSAWSPTATSARPASRCRSSASPRGCRPARPGSPRATGALLVPAFPYVHTRRLGRDASATPIPVPASAAPRRRRDGHPGAGRRVRRADRRRPRTTGTCCSGCGPRTCGTGGRR